MNDRILRRFLRWWGGELAALVPHALRRRLARPDLMVELAKSELALSASRGTGWHPLGRVPLSEDDAAQRVRRLARGRRGGGALLLLPAATALRRRLTLPAAVEENLREVLGFEMDRFTPVTAEQVVFDYRLLGRRKEEGLIEVELLVVPRGDLAPALAVLAEAGLRPSRIEVAGDPAFDLMPRELARTHWSSAQRLAAALAALAILLGIASLALEARNERLELAALEHAVAAARDQSVAVEGMRAQLAELRAATGRLAGVRKGLPPVLKVLEEVTSRLPDDSWAEEFDLKDGRLHISGFSARAALLIALLEDSPFLTDVRFESAVTIEPRLKLERFFLTATTQGGP